MTTGRGKSQEPPAGGPARHIPVLLHDATGALRPRDGGLYVDGTFGAGGYSRALLAVPGVRVIAFDRDPDAIRSGYDLVAASAGRLTLVEARFGDLAREVRNLGHEKVDGIVLDIGVSSMQFDQAARGFSFRFDGPLDMRMESRGPSAADIVNNESEERIADILYHYGEERASRRIARFIVNARKDAPLETTAALAELVQRAIPGKPGDIHPATRTFQALRIAVNDELGELVRALAGAEEILDEGGALAIVTFHSLEDRIVKQFFAQRSGRGAARSRLLPGEVAPPEPTFSLEGRQPIAPSHEEMRDNPRARSAKLRAGIRTNAPARGLDGGLMALASLPQESRGRGR
ncbi:MAG: 16S rRNA (cytosine(1402)-N(4))-methyltransferase RsmH [Hyphomicrobiales bacterium]|nr:16S rRNA (cytosine(1402)-N(4))-methyltransferase RsmH [Hyphomicrobiales bacterium]